MRDFTRTGGTYLAVFLTATGRVAAMACIGKTRPHKATPDLRSELADANVEVMQNIRARESLGGEIDLGTSPLQAPSALA